MILIIFVFFLRTEYAPVADIITSQAVLETGWFRSTEHNKRFNFFSMKSRTPWPSTCHRAICYMKKYSSIEAGLEAQLAYYRRHNYPTSRKAFLHALVAHGYAEDPLYIRKVEQISGRCNKMVEEAGDKIHTIEDYYKMKENLNKKFKDLSSLLKYLKSIGGKNESRILREAYRGTNTGI